jgi:RNA polymerase sigma-70 factor (ECF subfamily)
MNRGSRVLQLLDGNAARLRAREAEIWVNEEDSPSARHKASSRASSDDAAFSALVDRQALFVFRVAFAMLRSTEDAEDVVQETFMKLYRNGTWREMRDERGFLARTTWRVALDHLSARRPHHTAVASGSVLDDDQGDRDLANLPSRQVDPEQAAVEGDWHATIHRLIDALPEDLRQPLALSSVEGLTSREIAVILSVSEGTVRTRLMRARQVLKQKLAAVTEARHAK